MNDVDFVKRRKLFFFKALLKDLKKFTTYLDGKMTRLVTYCLGRYQICFIKSINNDIRFRVTFNPF